MVQRENFTQPPWSTSTVSSVGSAIGNGFTTTPWPSSSTTLYPNMSLASAIRRTILDRFPEKSLTYKELLTHPQYREIVNIKLADLELKTQNKNRFSFFTPSNKAKRRALYTKAFLAASEIVDIQKSRYHRASYDAMLSEIKYHLNRTTYPPISVPSTDEIHQYVQQTPGVKDLPYMEIVELIIKDFINGK